MDLNVLGNLGDFVGGVAVVVTLIYLAIQIRQNTAALKTASRQSIADGYRDSNRLRMDPVAALAWQKGLTSFPDLSLEENNYFNTIIIDEALFFQAAYALYESGQLEEGTYGPYLTWFSSILSTPGGTVWWETTGQPIFVPAMVSAVDARLAQGGLHDIRQLPGWRLVKE